MVAYSVKNRSFCPGIVAGFAALAVLVLAGGAGALSNDGGGSWANRKDIAISNSGGALSD